MSYYPIFLEPKGKNALVVGGGSVAQRKVENLLKHGASVRIVSRELTEKLKQLVKGNREELAVTLGEILPKDVAQKDILNNLENS